MARREYLDFIGFWMQTIDLGVVVLKICHGSGLYLSNSTVTPDPWLLYFGMGLFL